MDSVEGKKRAAESAKSWRFSEVIMNIESPLLPLICGRGHVFFVLRDATRYLFFSNSDGVKDTPSTNR